MPKNYVDYWMDHEFAIVVEFCKLHWLESKDRMFQCFFVAFTCATGVRIQEAVDLKVEDCYDSYFRVQSGKGGKARDVEVMPWFRPIYHFFLNQRKGFTYLFTACDSRWTKTYDRPVHVRQARRWWATVCDACGVRYISPHGGRRTFATWASEMLSQADLQDQLGHSDYRTTDRFYRGSMPGRRFEKIKPLWLQIGESWASDVAGRAKLRVVND